jgi:hypothetical protein
MVPFWKEALEMVLDVEPGMHPISLPRDEAKRLDSQKKTPPRSQTYPSSSPPPSYSTASSTSDSSSPKPASPAWCVPLLPSYPTPSYSPTDVGVTG